jgi:hypothetical protein
MGSRRGRKVIGRSAGALITKGHTRGTERKIVVIHI